VIKLSERKNNSTQKELFNLVGFLVFIIPLNVSFAQSLVISGYVTDASNGEVLVGTNVFAINLQQGTTTNQYGFFSLTIPSDSAAIRFSHQGFEALTLGFKHPKQEVHRIQLLPKVIAFDSLLVIEADEYDGLHQQVQMSSMEVSMEEVEALPALLGETDLLKVFQLMPGIQSGVEGSTGLYIRGGTPGQTLILLDGATVYNAGHLFGFMSTFNTDAINTATVLKGGFPSRYGGRLSGVLDVTMREGNRNKFEGRGAVGLVASRVTVEGPLFNGRSSFIVSVRRTYLDLITWGFQKLIGSDYIQGYHFYDVNAKWNMDVTSKDRVFVSFYAGRDKAYEHDRTSFAPGETDQSSFELDWNNVTLTSRWNRVFNSRLFSNMTILLSHFQSGILEELKYKTETNIGPFGDRYTNTGTFGDRYTNGLTDVSIKTDLEYFPHRDHHVRFGAMGTYHQFTPSIQRHHEFESALNIDTTIVIPVKVSTSEWSAYAEDEITLSRKLKANVGVHISGYVTQNSTYTSVQPRVSTSYLLPRDWAFKISYAQMQQYIQLLSNSGSGLPTDLWLPSTTDIPPQKAWQLATGIERTIDRYALDVSLEGYYKQMDGVIAYKEGGNLVGSNQNWEDAVTIGRGWTYGAEFYVRRKRGQTTGWISYTLSYSHRRFSDLNEGRVFPHRYDRRHDISIALVRELGRRKISVIWVYSTGHAVTLSTSRYTHEGAIIDLYSEHNGFRVPAYHRLDLSLHFPRDSAKPSEFILSFYNMYSRRNTFFIETKDNQNVDPYIGYYNEQRTIKKFTLFPIIPSLSYRFYF